MQAAFGQAHPKRRHWRRWSLLGVVAAVLSLSARLFVWPTTDAPRRSDAIVVLGGARPGRFMKGLALARAGNAAVLAISVSALPAGADCASSVPGVDFICFSPNPASTQGEARYVAALAERRHWGRIIVIASTTQVTRARIRFERWKRPSPCDGWRALDVLGHVGAAVEFGTLLHLETCNYASIVFMTGPT